MDLQMPVMDGYETARRIRAMRDPKLSAIPIVTMTANALARDLAPESACGVSRHLSKPIDLTALHAALCEVLHENRQQIAIETIKNTLWNHPQRIFRF